MIDSRATRMLAFATGDFDITFPSDVSVPLMKDIKARAPNAICEMITTGTQINLMVNRVNPPFDNPDIRKAMSLAIDRKAVQYDPDGGLGADGRGHAAEARGRMGHAAGNGVVADGVWSRHRQEYRGSAGRSCRSSATAMPNRCRSRFRREIFRPIAIAAVILTDQLKKIHIVGELDILDTPRWYARLAQEGLHDRTERDRRQRRRSRRQYRRELFAANRSATIRSTAMPRWTDCWPRNRANSTRRNAGKSSGTSSVSWSTTRRARSSCSSVGRQLLAALCRGISRRTTTASTTTCGSRKSGWINRRWRSVGADTRIASYSATGSRLRRAR